MTTVADGLFQYGGMPVGVNMVSNKIFSTLTKGRAWFVDPNHGAGGNGRSPKSAFTTMQAAFNSVQSGDIIYFVGKLTEQLVTPVQIFDVTVIGCGNRPRHADATPDGGNWAGSQWGTPASGGVAAQATVRVLQQGWRFVNILFTAIDTNAACVELVRNAAAGDLERDASHASFFGCRFVGAGIGIGIGAASYTELLFNVQVNGNVFQDMTTAIGGVGQLNQPVIENNYFVTNTNHINLPIEGGLIINNVFNTHTTQSVKLSGGIGTRPNIITKNYFSGTYSTGGGYTTHGASDEWAGNWNAAIGGAGYTVADPA